MVVIVERTKPKDPAQMEAYGAHLAASANVEEQYQNFDVVWGKMANYPWWPAVLFYSWDAVNDAGLDLKDTQRELVIPPPTLQTLPDGKGERLVHSVLIMFLDKFNCLVLELTPKTVCPFALNYDKLSKLTSKSAKKHMKGFKVALERAERLLHMKEHMTEEELDELAPIRVQSPPRQLEPPPPVQSQSHSGGGKRQKRSHQKKEVEYVEIDDEDGEEEVELEEEEEEEEDQDGSDYEESVEADSKKPSRANGKAGKAAKSIKKMSAKASQVTIDLSGSASAGKKAPSKGRSKRQGTFRVVEAIDDDEFEDDFEVRAPPLRAAAEKKDMAKKGKKPSRKEGRVHQQQDVINVDDEEEDGLAEYVMAMSKPPTKKKPSKAKSPKKAVQVAAAVKADASKVKKSSTTTKKKKKKKKKDHSETESDEEQDEYYEEEVLDVAPEPKKKTKKKQKKHAHENGDSLEKANSKSETKNESESPAPEPLTMTPLSTIWTTREGVAGGDQPGTENENAQAKTDSDMHASLAYKLDLVWDDELFTETQAASEPLVVDGGAVEDVAAAAVSANTNSQASVNGDRAPGRRQVRSVQQSQLRQSLMSGSLGPHTMVQCEAYLPKGGLQLSADVAGRGSRAAAPQLEAPFDVVVHPDAVFVCDLHAHLATCEIIGFLGGRWDDERKTLYIQAAFPCRSLVIEGDDGSTDVEMDPGSEIELREIIQNAELEVVGWYHSHPQFAPDPSVVDINNQSNYQQLFQRRKPLADGKFEVAEPFVGLIVGTYDARRESPVALFRYFHTRAERVNSGMRQEVNMPYELVPRKRHYRAVLESERLDPNRRTRWFVALAEMLLKKMRAGSSTATSNTDAKKRRSSTDLTAQRKRKGSTDMTAQRRESLTKKKRGRPSKAEMAARSVQGASHDGPEVIDLMSETTSQEIPSQSSEPASQLTESDLNDATEGKAEDATDVDQDVEMVVGESSQSQAEPIEIDIDSESVDEKKVLYRAMPAPLKEPTTSTESATAASGTKEPASVVSEEIVCDSGASQELPEDFPSVPEASKPVGRLSGKMEGDDDFVSASGSSSASSSAEDASSLSYDASQSQSMSQSQSQNDEAAPLAATPPQADSKMDEDDPYASVEILPSESPFKQSTPKRRKASRKDRTPPSKEPTTVDESNQEKTADDSEPPKPLHEPPAKRAITLSDSEDDIVKDSATDASVGANQEQQFPDRSPGEDDSGSNSAVSGGGSTPVDPSAALSNSRRRTRKSSIPIRRADPMGLGLSSSSAGGTSASPRLAQGSATAADGVVVDRPVATEVPVLESNHLTEEDAVWGSIDVIDLHDSEKSHPLSDADAPKPEKEKPLKLEEQSPVNDDCVKAESEPEVVDSLDQSKVLDVSTASKVEKQVPSVEGEAKPDPAASTLMDVVVETPEDSRSTPVKSETEKSELMAVVAPTPTLPPEIPAVTTSNVAHLEKLSVIELAQRVKQVTTLGRKQRTKAAMIAILREHEAKAAVTRKPNTKAGSKEHVAGLDAPPLACPVQEDPPAAPTAALVLTETKAVVLQLVETVEARVLADGDSAAASTVMPTTAAAPVVKRSKMERLLQRRERHLQRLRTEYGAGIYGCAEQVITLIDYYRDFDRRTDMIGWWKPRITKADKLEASLRADAQHVNIPVDQRDAFVADVMGYLRTSWEICSVRR